MTGKTKTLIGFKVGIALLGFAALVTEVVALVERDAFNFINFFSFFTVQNNMLAVVAFLLGAFVLASGKRSKAVDRFRTFVTVFMLVVGVGFALLLAGLEGVALTAVPWDNTVLHYIVPIAVLADFLLDTPKTKMRFTRALAWLLYPVAYLTYTMIRGAATGWYPYPFLNPEKGSVAEIIMIIGALVVFGVVLIWAATAYIKRRA